MSRGNKRLRVGLALGGGGARGYAHIGVIRELRRAGIPIDLVAGTSMGAIVGSVLAAGLDVDKLEQVIRRLDINKLLSFPQNALGRLVGRATSDYLGLHRSVDWRHSWPEETQRFEEFIRLLTKGCSFETLKLPFAAVAADLDTGEQVVLRSGRLAPAVAASTALPGIRYPVYHQGRFLIDGGVVNTLPIDVAFELGAEVVIAVDVSTPLARGAVTNLDVLFQAEAIVAHELNQLQLELMRRRHGDRLLVLEPRVTELKMLQLNEMDQPIQAGQAEARRQMPSVRRLTARGRAA